jgi:pimeloyl-ACP methyl ester carboxylesterase
LNEKTLGGLPDDLQHIALDGRGYRKRYYRSHDGLKLFYREYGDAALDSERLPVLCLSGLTRNSRDFHDLALRLAPGRRILALDYRGRGKSEWDRDWRNYRPETYLLDIFDLLAAADAPRVVVVGTSMGGLLAMGMATYRPHCLAGAVLNDIGPDMDPFGYQRILHYIGEDRPHPDWASAIADLQDMFPNLSFTTKAQWRRLAEGTYRRGGDGLLHYSWDIALARQIGASQARYADLWPFFRGLAGRPLLVLRGTVSDVLSQATLERMALEIPDLQPVLVPGVGHVPALDEKEALLGLDDFFARI